MADGVGWVRESKGYGKMQYEKSSLAAAGFEDEERGHELMNVGQPLEAGKCKDSPLEPPGRNAALPTP